MSGVDKVNRYGFTIVELLIVIVVIGILAAISIVAYNGIQHRASDTATCNSIRAIAKALELYKPDHGVYPPTIGFDVNGFCWSTTFPTGWSYSFATDDSWLRVVM